MPPRTAYVPSDRFVRLSQLLEQLIVKSEDGHKGSCQPLVLIGSAGSGKTLLIESLRDKVSDDTHTIELKTMFVDHQTDAKGLLGRSIGYRFWIFEFREFVSR